MRRISIQAATFSGNLGAEAMLSTTISKIRETYPDTEFNVFSYYPQSDRKLVKDPKIHIYNSQPTYLLLVLFPMSLMARTFKLLRILKYLKFSLPKSVQALASSSLLLDLAGVSFVDGRRKFLAFNILTIWPAFLLGVPVIKLSQALGPFQNYPNHFLAKLFLKRCKKIFARGGKTQEYLHKLKLSQEILESAADVAFLYQPKYSLTTEGQERVGSFKERLQEIRSKNNKIIGICPSAVIAQKTQNYQSLICEVIKYLIAQGYVVLLFPGASRAENMHKLRNNDLPLIAEISKQFTDKKDQIISIDFNVNTAVMKELVRFCELTIISRFHAMVAGLSLEIPVFVLGWGHKYQEVMHQFLMTEWVMDCQSEEKEILSKITLILSRLQLEKEKISKALPSVKELAGKQFEYVDSILKTS